LIDLVLLCLNEKNTIKDKEIKQILIEINYIRINEKVYLNIELLGLDSIK